MPSTEWKEVVPPDEDARFSRYAEDLAALQRKNTPPGEGALRALHAKAHAGLDAELEISEGVPEHARHGLFARPGKHRAYVRFSNGGPQRKSDKAPDVRGIAVKVLGVSGKKALGDGDEQDLLAIQSPSTPFRTADEFVAFVLAASGSQALLPFRFIGAVGFSRGVKILKRLASSAKPVEGLASVRFFSALPVRVGPFAARYAFTPENPPAAPAAERSSGYLAADLAEHLRKRDLTWRLEVQFFESEATTPIEDASVDWSAPYVSLGRLTLPKQDVSSDAGKALAARVEKMSFDPWHALVEHTPLGGMMRARKHAYFASVKGRG